MPTSDRSNRGVALDLLPPDGLSSVVVVKTVTPDLDGDAVGGTINFRTPSAFDTPAGLVRLSGQAGYDQLSRTVPMQVVGGAATFLDSDHHLGVFATAFYNKKKLVGQRDENLDANGSWRPDTGRVARNVLIAPKSLTLISHGLDRYTNDIERFGGNVSFDYHPSDTTSLYLRGFYAQLNNEQLHDYLDVRGRFSNTNQPLGFSTLMGAEVKGEDNRIAMISQGGSVTQNDVTLDYDAAYSFGRTRTPKQYYMEFDSGNTTDPAFGTPMRFSVANARYPQWVLSDAQAKAMYLTANLSLASAELYSRVSEDRQVYLASNIGWAPADAGLLTRMKAGVRVRQSRRSYNQHQDVDISTGDEFQLNGMPNGTLLSARPDLIGGTIDSFLGGNYRGNTRFGTILDMPKALALLEAAPRVNDVVYPWNLNNSRGRETSYSGYALAELGHGPLSAIAGARYEKTRLRNLFLAEVENPDGTTTRVFGGPLGTSTASYGHFLPSLHVNYRPDARLAVRGAAWTSFARPGFSDISAGSSIESNGSRITSISRGNPNLKSASAVNLDLGGDYLAGNTTLSVGAFYKHIRNFIYRDNTQTETITNGDGITISQPANGKSAWIWGVELAARQPLAYGFTLSGNFTYQKSEANPNIAYRDTVRPGLPYAPTYIGNIAMNYAHGPFEADVAYTYRGRYVASLRANAIDEYVQAQGTLDAGARFHIDQGVTLGLLAQNLTKAPSYWATRGADKTYTLGYQNYGRTFLVNLTLQR